MPRRPTRRARPRLPPVGLGATPASGSEVYLTWTNTADQRDRVSPSPARRTAFSPRMSSPRRSPPRRYYYTDGAAGLSPGQHLLLQVASDQLLRFVEQFEHGVREHPQCAAGADRRRGRSQRQQRRGELDRQRRTLLSVTRFPDPSMGGPFPSMPIGPRPAMPLPRPKPSRIPMYPPGPHLHLRDRGGKRCRFQRRRLRHRERPRRRHPVPR